MLLVCWLIAAATGESAFNDVQAFNASWIGKLLLFGWSYALFYHLCNGIRHLFWDAGKGFELESAYRNGWLVVAASIALTVIGLLPPLLNQALIDDVIVPTINVDAENTVAVASEKAAREPPPTTRLLHWIDTTFASGTPSQSRLLLWVILGLLGVYILRGLISGVRMYALGWLGQRIVYDLQMQIFHPPFCHHQ